MKWNPLFSAFKKGWVIELLVTALSTIFGVYYGFLLTDRREEREINEKKQLVVKNILEEVANNKKDIEHTIKSFQVWLDFETILQKLDGQEYGYQISKDTYDKDSIHRALFWVGDSIEIEDQLWYQGNLGYRFEITNFSFIAYETAKMADVLNELDFQCLYDIESAYQKQRQVSQQMETLVGLMQQTDANKMRTHLKLSMQFCKGLMDQYAVVQSLNSNCK
ncbi:MAG: hypothetical protein Tsb004_27960 [Allomuricauda sp.]